MVSRISSLSELRPSDFWHACLPHLQALVAFHLGRHTPSLRPHSHADNPSHIQTHCRFSTISTADASSPLARQLCIHHLLALIPLPDAIDDAALLLPFDPGGCVTQQPWSPRAVKVPVSPSYFRRLLSSPSDARRSYPDTSRLYNIIGPINTSTRCPLASNAVDISAKRAPISATERGSHPCRQVSVGHVSSLGDARSRSSDPSRFTSLSSNSGRTNQDQRYAGRSSTRVAHRCGHRSCLAHLWPRRAFRDRCHPMAVDSFFLSFNDLPPLVCYARLACHPRNLPTLPNIPLLALSPLRRRLLSLWDL